MLFRLSDADLKNRSAVDNYVLVNPSRKQINNSTIAWLFWLGIALIIIPVLLHAYLLMPFPGSQNLNAITFSYYLEKALFPLRLIGAAMLLFYIFRYFALNTKSKKIYKAIVILLCVAGYYMAEVKYNATEMFKEPKAVRFAKVLRNKVPMGYLIIGVVHNGVAKAYPVMYLGYHHKIQDNVGNQPVLVTYCTMCRSGRVFNPVVDGKKDIFRLVGARHYNAVIEDDRTKSWWYQATGIAAAGPLKGSQLQELPYEQSTLSAWLAKYPSSLILQPDADSKDAYAELKDYDREQPVDKDENILNKDSLVRKSWILGVVVNKQAKAYDWKQLSKTHLLNDKIENSPLLIGLEKDSLTFHAWQRLVDGKELHFKISEGGLLTDLETSSLWDWNGCCVSGINKGKKMEKVQAYQEYWHSWKQFHPATSFEKIINSTDYRLPM